MYQFSPVGFWNNFTSASSIPEAWNSIQSVDQLNAILAENDGKTKVFFKHSTRCGISLAAMSRLKSMELPQGAESYYIDLLEHRDVSNAIEQKTNVVHQSPQLIVWKDGRVIGHGSHDRVSQELIKSNLSL